MCGFVGFLGGNMVADSGVPLLRRMADTIANRGPDDDGYWWDPAHQVGFGHRRLAIVDLSAAGHQPMASAAGRYVIAFNGEIYNHLLLRQRLEAEGLRPAWRGHSDTETLLAGFDAWGIEATVRACIGMFAFAVWDHVGGTLTLGRDRLGEKPLYWGWQGSGADAALIFGSELKALRVHPAFENRIDRGALTLLLRHNYVPAPYSIYAGIAKLAPGHLLTLTPGQRDARSRPYWSALETASAGVAAPFGGTPEQAVNELETLLKDAIGQQMMADVPLGAFLSGGVDSSTVVALMQAQSARPVKTFTIGFHEQGYNEAEHAKAVAAHLGTEHTELYVTAQQAMDVIPRLPTLYDEPFADSSQIPTFLVSQLARRHVTVSLSGDAGDELFCGYGRYAAAGQLWDKIRPLPLPLRQAGAWGVQRIAPASWNSAANLLRRGLGRAAKDSDFGGSMHKRADVLKSDSLATVYHKFVSHLYEPAAAVIGGHEPPTVFTAPPPALAALGAPASMMATDMLSYLPDDILAKVDRAAMGVSLETRVPFLDHRVVEFAWRLPQELKVRDGQAKWALRQVLYRHVPRALIDRPKMGFAVPIRSWLRGPLREWAEALLDADRLRRDGFFEPALIRRQWADHLAGRRNLDSQLWNVLMFNAWLDVQPSHPL
ncbi:MAG: asparagine synthase (glutamine-hydrolyzing) [Pseudomonadota bacterium]